MFHVYNGTATQEHFLFTVSNKQELDKKSGTCLNHTLVIQNHKGEYCDRDLNVIPRPETSIESLVGLMQDKFQTKKRKHN